ncbi:MAG: FHA domain-containing protein [Desulfatibacillaceae bacterium]|nr:FHA domain-containing protein [Desulfatibacillaceae bacterium]
MPKVILKFRDNTIAEFAINKGGTLSIGRLNDNQIVVENLAVSGHHAKIDAVGDGYLLTDLQSKNSTFVNKEKVASHWLAHNDEITIGKHTLVFLDEAGAGQAKKPSMGDLEKTMVMDTAMHREMLAKGAQMAATAPQPGQPAPAAPSAPNAVLTYLAGGSGEMEITRKLIKIGKAPENDIKVSGFLVGATAATISKRPAGYFLGFVSGFTKPKVNGQAVKESVQLKDYDTIEVGSVKLQFTLGKP